MIMDAFERIRKSIQRINRNLDSINKRLDGWHTGTPTEEGWYLLQYLNSGEYDVGRWDGSDFVIEENLPMVLTSHRSVAWQRIEPYTEAKADYLRRMEEKGKDAQNP